MNQKGLGLFEFLMDFLQISIKDGVLNGQSRLIGEHAEKVNVLHCNRVLVVKVVHQNDTNDLSFPQKRDGGKRIDFRITTEMLADITSHFRTQMTTPFTSGLNPSFCTLWIL